MLRADIEAALWMVVSDDGWMELPGLMLLLLIGHRWVEEDGRRGWIISEAGAVAMLTPHDAERSLDNRV